MPLVLTPIEIQIIIKKLSFELVAFCILQKICYTWKIKIQRPRKLRAFTFLCLCLKIVWKQFIEELFDSILNEVFIEDLFSITNYKNYFKNNNKSFSKYNNNNIINKNNYNDVKIFKTIEMKFNINQYIISCTLNLIQVKLHYKLKCRKNCTTGLKSFNSWRWLRPNEIKIKTNIKFW